MSAISRLYQSARSLLLNQSQCKEESDANSTNVNDTVVKTTEIQEMNVLKDVEKETEQDELKYTQVSRSAKKRNMPHHQGVEEVTIASCTKKLLNLPTREKTCDTIHIPKTRPVVEIVLKKDPEFISQKTETPRTKSIQSEICEIYNDGYTTNPSINATPVKPNGETSESTPFFTARHHRFDSENILDTQLPSAAKENPDKSIEPLVINDESDNDVPEEISTHSLELTAKLRSTDIAKVIAARKLKSRKKRRVKEKAQRNRQIIPQDHSEKEVARSGTKKASNKNLLPEQAVCIKEKNLAEVHSPRKELVSRSINSKNSLPDLLPLEYLEDDDTARFNNSSTKSHIPKSNTKIKFSDLVEKKPKDRIVGNTTYRVIKPSDQNLAPKASLNARRIKESWLQGRTGRRQQSNRQRFSKSFNRI